ncbi:MAG: cupin domain-containing protein [Chloroflexota bacterium]|nr:cupin domain-containing protein [Chloroflexota bacterium]
MNQTKLFPDWKDTIVYGSDGPEPQILVADEKAKIILAGLEPGQTIPDHAEAQAMYHFLEGNGWMIVGGERMPVSAGATVVMPEGAVRGMEAETRLAFLAVRIS